LTAPSGEAGKLRRRVVLSAAAAAAIYVAFAVYADFAELARHLARFRWELLPLVMLLTLGNYTGRLVKWQWYLRLVGAGVGWGDATRIFGVAMSMVLTPGKAGELLKSYMVKNVSGTPMRVTAPIVLAERLTDGIAMLLLASVGLYSFRDPALLRLSASILAVMAAVVVAIQIRPLGLWLLRVGEAAPLVSRRVAALRDFYESSYLLLRPRNLLLAVAIGTVSWACEGVAYYLVLVGVGADPGAPTVLAAVFVFSISSILGAVIPTPGGLGGTETGLTGLSVKLLSLSRPEAVTATLVVRFATLWFGVGLGLACFARWHDLMAVPAHDGRTTQD
jgi:uncharacterized protein (TIRG00374 family)